MVRNRPFRFPSQGLIADQFTDSQRCLKRRLKAKFEASPIDPAAAEKLQRRRDRRQLCVCTPLQQASINV